MDSEQLDPATEVERLRRRVRELEDALGREQAARRALWEHAPEQLLLCDLEGRISDINRVLDGFERGLVVGRSITEFVPPAHVGTVLEALARCTATRQPVDLALRAPGAAGRTTHFRARYGPVLQGDRVTGVVAFIRDVDRLEAAEAELREREAKLDVVLEATGMGMWFFAPHLGDGGSDERCAGLLGVAPEIPRTPEVVMAAIHPDDRERVATALAGAEHKGSYGPLEHRVLHPGGEVRWLRAVGKLLRREDGPLLVGGVVDITEQKRLESELVEAQKLEGIGRLAGGVAHDFNNLLTAILGSAELAAHALPEGDPVRADLDDIRSAAERGATLTGQLLAFARRQMIEPRVLSPSALVLDVERLLRRVLGERIELVTECSASGSVRADRNQLERVLLNLATNARDAMPSGGRLTLSTEDVVVDESQASRDLAPGAYVRLTIADTGAGIPAELLPHLFEPFFTTKGLGRGTGLGLAMCYGIVRQAGGQIEATSEPGRGSTFRIHLPRVASEVGPAQPSRQDAPGPGTGVILVVEDEEPVRRATVRALRGFGYEVLEAADGIDALSLCETYRGPIDALVTDVVMPGLSGRELAERLRSTRPELPVLYVSGYTDDAIVHDTELDEGLELLQKPFAPATLHARIQQLLARRPSP